MMTLILSEESHASDRQTDRQTDRHTHTHTPPPQTDTQTHTAQTRVVYVKMCKVQQKQRFIISEKCVLHVQHGKTEAWILFLAVTSVLWTAHTVYDPGKPYIRRCHIDWEASPSFLVFSLESCYRREPPWTLPWSALCCLSLVSNGLLILLMVIITMSRWYWVCCWTSISENISRVRSHFIFGLPTFTALSPKI